MAATASVVETQDNTSAFLSDLLGSIGMGKSPEKTIADLDIKTLTRIVSRIPLRERINLSFVSQQLHGAVRASITSLNFYRDCLDCLPDDQVREMLQQYGSQITSLNFDLFKSTFGQETSQWAWRQTVLTWSGMCPNLTELSILICNRHRLRDKDLVTIFEKCPNLTKLCVDAQFLNGHCFKKAPVTLSHVEMEMCYRISDQSLRIMFGRFRNMKTLHVSQLLVLTDAHVSTMVRSFRNLQELSIVSHVDTKYEGLTGSGLAELGKLQKLRVLCLEGISAVTDRTLTVISDPQTSPSASSITAISLAFCFNVSQHGLKHLGRMTSLVDLNIDGITKRDVSMGVEKIAAEGRLLRLFVAERTNISPEALVTVVSSCPHLRLLDISNNEECFNWVTADKIMYLWCNPSATIVPSVPRAPLTILTDEHLAWNCVGTPEKDEFGRTPLLVVHINRGAVPENEMLPTNALSDVRPSELPPGLLAPHIRRGNRYRLLWAPLGPSRDIKVELLDEDEKGTSVAELARRTSQEMEEKEEHDRSCSSLDADEDVSSSYSMEGVECVGLFGNDPAAATGGVQWGNAVGGASDENMPPAVPLPPDFSMTPISTEGDPHSKDWSMDVISLLLKTYAYEDGAMVGPMTVKEGVIIRPDGTVEDICTSILSVDASLRARYHMTAALSGARRFGPHTYNTRDAMMHIPVPDAVTTDISSAIDDFLGEYVPEGAAAATAAAVITPASIVPKGSASSESYRSYSSHFEPTQHLQLRPRQGQKSENEGQFGHCENEAPAAGTAGAVGYHAGGRFLDDRPSPPMRYPGYDEDRHRQRLELDSLQLKEQFRRWEGKETTEATIAPHPPTTAFHTHSSPFVPMHLRGGLSAPAVSSTSFPFPPPAYLLAPHEAPSSARPPVHRPYGRLRGGAAGTAPAPSPWANAPPGTKFAPLAPHPYADAAYRMRSAAAARTSVLRPKN